jgi:hypothetical protein
LPLDHLYRRNTKSFRKDKRRETSQPILRASGDEIWNRICHLPKIIDTKNELGKDDGIGVYYNWAKMSILGFALLASLSDLPQYRYDAQ